MENRLRICRCRGGRVGRATLVCAAGSRKPLAGASRDRRMVRFAGDTPAATPAFTLVELIVVMTIILVLAGLIQVEAGARLILYSPGGKIGERTMKKLHRIAEDRKIAGVCAGLGDYFDLDPVFFRLFFLVSLLFGGVGALAYLILWIMVPEKTGAQGAPRPLKRLHLSNSDRKIGGVCGGLGERFEIDPVLFRVAFILLALACGLGILLYVALWLLVPRAPAVPAVST